MKESRSVNPQPLHMQAHEATKWRDGDISRVVDNGIVYGHSTKRSYTRAKTYVLTLVGLLALGSTFSARGSRNFAIQPVKTSSNWQTIEPSSALRWYKCYDGELECARLEVPMDWQSPSPGSRVTLAVARLRANISEDDANYRGPIFFNPGGPGGSGIFALKDRGALLQTIVGANHDIVTFDPRGIGASTPLVDCWGGDSVRRALWAIQEPEVVDQKTYPAALSDTLVRATAFSERCQHQMSGPDSLLEHLSTASHARDLLEILNQMGQVGLKYWGFSYGTILGGTFAAMYPDRVERLVSDGNVDYREWHLGQHINFIRDADKVMDAFYEYCHLAGEKCAMHAATPLAIRARVDTILQTVKSQPVIVSGSQDGRSPEMPFIVTYSRLKRAISAVLYRPVHKFEPFANVLLALEKGDGWPFWDFVRSGDVLPSAICPIDSPPPSNPMTDLAEDTDDAFPAIMCADAEPLLDSIEDMGRYASELQQISDAAGAVNVLFRAACAGRTVRPKWRYKGPFEGNTSFPILYIANTADNVTPLISARNNSAGFPGSVILVQNSYGHTTLAAPSTCTARHIRAYFQDGTLPPQGAQCEPDIAPFGVFLPGTTDREDAQLSVAIRLLSDAAR